MIDGYEDLKINLTYNGFDFCALLNITYKDKLDTAEDVEAKLMSSLPEGFVRDKNAFVSALRKTLADYTGPPGKCVETYKFISPAIDGKHSTTRSFQINECKLEDNEHAQKLLANLQTLSLWFIEGADTIDVTDPRWLMYLTYEQTDGGKVFNPVGYVTVFKFFNPIGRKAAYCNADQNETHRICQALIFPTYQRQGHAERLVHCIHARAAANPRVYELTVEDPVPAFASLRDLVNLKSCVENNFFSLSPELSVNACGPGVGTKALTINDIHAVQKTLKITQTQVQICYEARKFSFLNKHDEIERKKFRLEVKKRLFRQHAEELDVLVTADQRKAFLGALYEEHEVHYRYMASKIAQFISSQS
ncbi:hypothetical protein CCR75_000726 [Bremia lactucae]|uniref:histone acetyltransferase n=1 Tax=Bremia lactucae TaxID=4779 RepID=A0A976FI62_BRELC|nr:hypothetical protein CCR75_000726 [Bremia lactucae]